MDTNNYSHLISLSSNKKEKEKIRMILNEINPERYESVPDPYYGENDGFQTVYNMLNKACEKIAEKLK